MQTGASVEPHLFVIFGATGDLARRKLLPALYRLASEREALEACHVLGVARSERSDSGFREEMQEALSGEAFAGDERFERWTEEQLFYQSLGGEGDDFEGLKARIEEVEGENDLSGNRVFYLALPPAAYGPTAEALGQVGLAESDGWARLVIEKPFGHDLASAQALNERVHQHFGEEQVYRIDHYLGKETVQNLLAFRFGNALFESVWDREHVERVEITAAESLGVGSRAGYYDDAGHLRDMVQNHLTQLLCLTGMEAPTAFTAEAIRREKVKLLESVRRIDPEKAVFGQYTAGEVDGEPACAYREEHGVPSDSDTETFVELELEVANWRWEGVPFRLKTGKRLPEKRTQIAVHFRCAPVSIFEPFAGSCAVSPNRLVITLQPDEGFDLFFEVKRPGEGVQLQTQRLGFDYSGAFGTLPGAYRALLRDVLIGDQTLFVRADEVEASWKLYDPLLEAGLPAQPYPAGSEGPAEHHHADEEEESYQVARAQEAASSGAPLSEAEQPETGDQREAKVRVFGSHEAMSRAAARRVTEVARGAVEARGRFTLALAGGETPRRLYELLAQARSMPWEQSHLFFGDERFVPHVHPESNYHTAADALIRRARALPESHVHPVPTDLATPELAAETYERQLRHFFGAGGDGSVAHAAAPAFDVVLLGLGSDGHTASLFPGARAPETGSSAAAVGDGQAAGRARWAKAAMAPEGYAVRQRVTLAQAALSAARHIFFLVSGEEKRAALQTILRGDAEAERWPAAQLRPSRERVWWVDRAAHGARAGVVVAE